MQPHFLDELREFTLEYHSLILALRVSPSSSAASSHIQRAVALLQCEQKKRVIDERVVNELRRALTVSACTVDKKRKVQRFALRLAEQIVLSMQQWHSDDDAVAESEDLVDALRFKYRRHHRLPVLLARTYIDLHMIALVARNYDDSEAVKSCYHMWKEKREDLAVQCPLPFLSCHVKRHLSLFRKQYYHCCSMAASRAFQRSEAKDEGENLYIAR